MSQIFIRATQGLTLRDPSGNKLPIYGAAVEKNSFWVRRIRSGDAEEIPEAEFNKGKKAFEKAASKGEKNASADTSDSETQPPAGA